ncbi:MAG: porin family protein [Bacteroidota bacterium]
MKKLMIIFALLFAFQTTQAQIKFGLRGGMNFSSLPEKTYDIESPQFGSAEIKTLSDNYTGFHIGVMSQINLLAIFIQPELLFVSTGNEMQVVDTDSEDEGFFTQRFSKIDVPVLVGTKLGPVRLGVGPVASVLLNSESDIEDRSFFTGENLNEKYNSATFGFQVGAGVNIGSIALDLKYEGSLSKLSDGLTVGDNTYNFDTRPRQFILSIGLLF